MKFLMVFKKLLRMAKKHWQIVAMAVFLILCFLGKLQPIKVKIVELFNKVTGRLPASE